MVKFVLGDGRGNYIRYDKFSGKYVSIGNKKLAEVWEERYKAQNILKNAINKKDRKRFKVIDYDDGENEIQCHTVSEVNQQEKIDLHIEAVKEISQKKISGENQIEKWQDGLNKFTGFIMETEKRKGELVDALSNIDKEVTDVEHYIELNNLNAYQGFLAYKMLQNRLKQRRKIKNELQVLSQLGNCKIDSTMMLDVQDAIKLLDNKKYTPRVLVGLFN